MSLYRFITFLIAFGVVSIFLVVALTGEWKLISEILPILIALPVSAAIRIGLDVVVTEPLSKKAGEAPQGELQREDDVLLQAVAFSQTVLFFFVNIISVEVEIRMILGGMIAVFTIIFYILRAVAKIKNNSKYRYYSMFVLSFVISNTITTILTLITGLTVSRELINSIINLIAVSSVYYSISESFADLTRNVFKKRYGI
jgi:hypothetical protein